VVRQVERPCILRLETLSPCFAVDLVHAAAAPFVRPGHEGRF